jgi:hypothetical protein
VPVFSGFFFQACWWVFAFWNPASIEQTLRPDIEQATWYFLHGKGWMRMEKAFGLMILKVLNILFYGLKTIHKAGVQGC